MDAGPAESATTQALRAAMQDHAAGRREAALRGYRAILAATPDHAPTLYYLGRLLHERDALDEAASTLDRAAAGGVVAAHATRGWLELTRNDFAAAVAPFRAALKHAPDDQQVRRGLGQALLALGRFDEGWPLFDDARDDPGKAVGASLGIPEWRGEPLAGKRLFVWREQGFGDQIQMARFIPQLAGAHVTYAGRPELQRLFAGLPLDYLPITGPWQAGPFDYWTLPMSLPRWLGATEANLPAPPYLHGSPRSTGGIGVVWRGNALPHPQRSLSDAAGRALLSLPGAISLDPADTGATDFQATADLIAGLDLVISVDTSVAHLAGAMGKPVWILLPARELDWRWGQSGDASVWYPSARLYRQARPDDWMALVEGVIRDVAAR